MLLNTSGQKVGCQLVSATDGSAFTGSVTVAVTVDAGTQATGSVGSGACAHEGGGYHTYAPAQAETNGALIAFTFSGTGAVPATVQVYTRAANLDAAAIADGIMTRASSNFEASAPVKSLGTALMYLCHKVVNNAGGLEVYRSNGSTLHATRTETGGGEIGGAV